MRPFSFGQWARDIASNPDGPHLSVEEALAQLNATRANTLSSPRNDPYMCGNVPNLPAYGPDAVECINYLAGLGNTLCEVHGFSLFCKRPHAEIVGVTGNAGYDFSTCQHVAQFAGGIMDRCYHDDHVQGLAYVTDNMAITIDGVQS
ncbi:hypothetical protein VHEMI08609 [[Torrubiella] hemipterigena]|uniref:Uncharacterized protein n=1 Tax=[Torrubiella] hemipterigena TaxID=1531966 RepID=A0A0A1TNS0_9HYPO|nr:hypothetical protein VHEMI08609 [[Torrubiella] hemipterigena]